MVRAWRAAKELRSYPGSGERGRWERGGQGQEASWEVTLKWLLKGREVCQAVRWAGWGPPQRRNSMCRSLSLPVSGAGRGLLPWVLGGPGAGWLEVWVSGLQRALLGPLLKAA